MTKLTNSRTGIWTHVSLCSSCSCPTPSVSLFWTPFSHRLSVCMSLCRMQLSGFPLSLLSPLLSCPFVSCPGSFHSVYFFFPFSCLNDGGRVGHFLDSELWQPHPSLKKSLLLHLSQLAWHQSRKRLPMTRWTFSVCKLYNSANDFVSV